MKKSEVSFTFFFCYVYILNMFLTVWSCLEPILASDEINRAQSLDELHTRLAAIRGKEYKYRFLESKLHLLCYDFMQKYISPLKYFGQSSKCISFQIKILLIWLKICDSTVLFVCSH